MNRTKKVISNVFWQLLEEKPYGKITVQNIVERCQISRNSFYYHFQDIPALVDYSIQEWTEEDKSVFSRYYKCIFAGIALDWLDAGASYDFLAFCEKICDSFEGSGKRALLKQVKH